MRKVILLAAALCALFPNSDYFLKSDEFLRIIYKLLENNLDLDQIVCMHSCCQAHDNCYFATSCSGVLSYIFTSYRFKIDTNTKTATCNPFQSQCRRELCDCDVIASQCFKDNLDSYDPNNKRD